MRAPSVSPPRPCDSGDGGAPQRAGDPFDYALLRVVPRVERGERINVGVVLFCRARDFLDVRLEPDERRLLALSPGLDLEAVRGHLDFVRRVCAGDRACGFVAELPQAERFGWLVSPSSTIVQPSRVHAGLCADPAAALDRLLATLVRPG
ncbi:hypothetical protein SOCE26_017760 [Sorangium cellulosum]|uniref:DUF3037 domain-containing protein n=1 Tax=Sorangium cellulosum TaxID=56 RepID=A0A2L0EM51_SORCE|nr:DUF3037 domain-containing protein [Sorangium cellulosum]AUX40376.1 hypothetical protein SOCE26_017760 [Sorangium cellulosum]